MADENFQQKLLEEVALFFEPVSRPAGEPTADRLYDFFSFVLGWDLPTVLGSEATAFFTAAKAVATAVTTIAQAADTPPQTLAELVQALQKVGDAADAVADLPEHADLQPPAWDDLAQDLLAALMSIYLRRRAPRALALAEAIGLFEAEESAETVVAGTIVRPKGTRTVFVPDRMTRLLSDPTGELTDLYLLDNLATQADADLAARRLFPALSRLLVELGAVPLLGAGDDPTAVPATVEDTFNGLLTFVWPARLADGSAAELGATLALVGRDKGGPGLFVATFGDATVSTSLGAWDVDAVVGTAVPGVLVTAANVSFTQPRPSGVHMHLKLTKPAVDGVAYRIGSTTGTRLEVGGLAVKASALLRQTEQDYGFELEASQAKLVVKPADGDGFLQKVLPANGVETTFDLALGWSNRKGVYFRGSAGLELTLPVHQSIFGVVTVDSVYVAILLPSGSTDLQLALAVTGSAKLGPVVANVEKMGLQATLAFPAGGGNLGPASLDDFGFKPPTGVGLSIDAGPVKGGGYLSFDAAKDEYAGAVYLSFNKISLTAIGLLSTKLPGGQSGFSLLVIITARFPPIQLGFGFTLTGVGGLLGINRSVVVGALQSAVRDHTLDAYLFPTLPIANMQQLVSSVSAAFPPAEGRYVFGPVVQINWGTPKILTIELGVALELPEPVRLIVMGKVRLALPDDTASTVVLQMDFLGVVDFGERQASIDATLVDSKIGSFPVTGDMAMRASWGATRTFALSVGGFHPSFAQPPGFPSLDRLAIAIASGDNPRVRLDAYVALTSNTAQVGAHLDVYAAVDLGKTIGKYTVQALFGFDALFHFHPFSLVAGLSAVVALKRNDKDFAAVSLAVTLTGPKPWHAWGSATFEFLEVSHSVDFDVQIGGSPPADALPTADLLPALREAIKSQSSWSAQLPAAGSTPVTLGDFKSTAVLAHPLGRLEFHQRVVPLDVTITRVGNAVPAGASRFELGVTVNGAVPSPAPEPVKDDFAPAQFFDLTDAEKLARPSFEQFDSGFRFATGAVSQSGPASQTTFAYETKVVDVRTHTVRTLGKVPSQASFVIVHAKGAHGTHPFLPYDGEEYGIKYTSQNFAVATRGYLTAKVPNTNLGWTEATAITRAFNPKVPSKAYVQVVHQWEATVVSG